MARAVEHYEIAAKQGDIKARHNLGTTDHNAGNHGLALKHFMISAKMGCELSLDDIKEMYAKGLASKADYAEALRWYHDAVKEMSSPERDEPKHTGMRETDLGKGATHPGDCKWLNLDVCLRGSGHQKRGCYSSKHYLLSLSRPYL